MTFDKRALDFDNGGELEQIQFLLVHVSVLTTERYLGCKQNLERRVNDRFGCLFSRAPWIYGKGCSRQRTIHIPRSLEVRMQVVPTGRVFIGMSNAA